MLLELRLACPAAVSLFISFSLGTRPDYWGWSMGCRCPVEGVLIHLRPNPSPGESVKVFLANRKRSSDWITQGLYDGWRYTQLPDMRVPFSLHLCGLLYVFLLYWAPGFTLFWVQNRGENIFLLALLVQHCPLLYTSVTCESVLMSKWSLYKIPVPSADNVDISLYSSAVAVDTEYICVW